MRTTLMQLSALLLLIVAAMLLVSCQGRPSEKPPIHLNPDMDNQPRYNPQSASDLFDDGATMREPIAGTVARGELRTDDAYYLGLDESGQWLDKSPVPVTLQMLERGRERYDIYCAPCHSRLGDGKGIMIQRGYVPPPTFHDKRLREMTDGNIFEVISIGVRNMPAYAHQIPVEDRWAIVAYARALQRSQNASIDDVPTELREKIK